MASNVPRKNGIIIIPSILYCSQRTHTHTHPNPPTTMTFQSAKFTQPTNQPINVFNGASRTQLFASGCHFQMACNLQYNQKDIREKEWGKGKRYKRFTINCGLFTVPTHKMALVKPQQQKSRGRNEQFCLSCLVAQHKFGSMFRYMFFLVANSHPKKKKNWSGKRVHLTPRGGYVYSASVNVVFSILSTTFSGIPMNNILFTLM